MTINVTVHPAATCLGFHLSIVNAGTQAIEAVILNPYTGVTLYSLDKVPIGKDSFFTWEQSDPHIILNPGHFVLAFVRLSGVRTDINSEIIVRAQVKWRSTTTQEFQCCCAEGKITLSCPPWPRRTTAERKLPFSAIVLPSKSTRLNVSDWVSILDYSDKDNPPWRGKPIGMWGP
jgi:hypothetical protein